MKLKSLGWWHKIQVLHSAAPTMHCDKQRREKTMFPNGLKRPSMHCRTAKKKKMQLFGLSSSITVQNQRNP